MLTRDELARVFPRAKSAVLDAIAADLPALDRFGISAGPTRAAYFFAQVAHESAGLNAFEENLSYSAARLREVWPARFPTAAAAKTAAKNPEALAEIVYGGRMGNTKPGDGYLYRGRGGIGITGRDAYRVVGSIVGLDLEADPDLAANPAHVLTISAGVWAWKNGNAFADRDDLFGMEDADSDDFVPLSRAINGGLNGVADRKDWLDKLTPIIAAAFKRRTASPAPVASSGQADVSPDLIRAAQQALAALGYHEVGMADGKMGSRTRAAILAFQADNGLTLDPTITMQLFEDMRAAQPRKIAEERATGKPEASAVIASSNGAAAVGAAGSVTGALGVIAPMVDQAEQGSALLARFKVALEPVMDMAASAWPVLILAAGVAVVFFALRARAARIAEHQSGRSA